MHFHANPTTTTGTGPTPIPSPVSPTTPMPHQTTLALRDNNPQERDGLSSLHLLDLPHPGPGGGGHRRKGSDATAYSNMTLASPTPTHVDSSSERSGSRRHHHKRKSDSGDDTDGMPLTPTTVAGHEGEYDKHSHSRSRSRGNSYAGTQPDSSHPNASSGNANQGDGEGEEEDDEDEQKPTILSLEHDSAHLDLGSFSYKPYDLALMVDGKMIEKLEEMGGVGAVLRGLGTHPTRGLSEKALGSNEVTEVGGGVGAGAGAGEGAGQRHDRDMHIHEQDQPIVQSPTSDTHHVPSPTSPKPPPDDDSEDEGMPTIMVTDPEGTQNTKRPVSSVYSHDSRASHTQSQAHPSALPSQSEEAQTRDMLGVTDEELKGPAYDAGLEERRRVYGRNELPPRKTKALWELMWLALKDKVLVRSPFLLPQAIKII